MEWLIVDNDSYREEGDMLIANSTLTELLKILINYIYIIDLEKLERQLADHKNM